MLSRSAVLRLEVSGSSIELVGEFLLAFLFEDLSGILYFSLFFCSGISKVWFSSEVERIEGFEQFHLQINRKRTS